MRNGFLNLISGRASRKPCARGASVVETALTIPIFLIAILTLIDLCRFFFAYCFLHFAAYSAVDLGTKLEIETDISQCPPSGNSAGQFLCREYIDRIDSIVNKALEKALLVAGPPGSGNSIELIPFNHYYYGTVATELAKQVPSSQLPLVRAVAVIRPGERVERMNDHTQIEHRTRSSVTGPPKVGESWNAVLRQEPIEVRIEAFFRPIFPLLPVFRLTASQQGYRFSTIQGTGGVPNPPTPVPPTNTPPPAPTRTRTPTPIGGVVGATPTITPTPLRSCSTCSPSDCWDPTCTHCTSCGGTG